MDFLELVKSRESTRRYRTDTIPRDVIDRCLEAARLAPSACNSQPWSFVVVDDPKLKEEFVNKVFSGTHSMNTFAKSAPVIIAVIREKESYTSKLGGFFRGVKFSLMDIGIAVANFILQAQALGVGSCILGWFNEKEAKRILNIPRSKKIDILISLGYPGPSDIESPRPKIRKSFKETVRYNLGE